MNLKKHSSKLNPFTNTERTEILRKKSFKSMQPFTSSGSQRKLVHEFFFVSAESRFFCQSQLVAREIFLKNEVQASDHGQMLAQANHNVPDCSRLVLVNILAFLFVNSGAITDCENQPVSDHSSLACLQGVEKQCR